jgi:phosphate transport system substrate-binding protein
VKALARPEVDKFVTYYLDNTRKLSAEVGYIALPEKADQLAKTRYTSRKTGSMFEGGSKVGVTMEALLEAESK